MLTEEQKANRKTGIYGTDAAIICGKNPYKTPYQLWEEKTGLRVEEDISHKSVIKAGNYLEPVICKWFEDESGLNVESGAGLKEFQHKEYSWMRGHIDGRVWADAWKTQHAVFEAKTASVHQAKHWGDAGDNRIPVQYLLQVAHYCAITDLPKAYIAVLIGGNDFRIYTYDRNMELESKLIEREKHFWEVNVLGNVPPDFVNAEDVMKGCEVDKDSELVASDALSVTVEMLANTKENIKALEEEEKNLRDAICLQMKGKEILVDAFGNHLVTWKEAAAAKRFEVDRFKKENPELYELYLKQDKKGSRRFLIK